MLDSTNANKEAIHQLSRFDVKFKIDTFKPRSALKDHVYECPIKLHSEGCDSNHLSDIEFQEKTRSWRISDVCVCVASTSTSTLPQQREKYVQIRIHNPNFHKS